MNKPGKAKKDSSCKTDRLARPVPATAMFLTAIVCMCIFYADMGRRPVMDEIVYDTIAVNIVQGRGVSLDGASPTAFVGPVYPLFLAGIYTLFGYRYSAVYIVQIILAVLTTYVTYRMGRVLTGSESAAGWGALFVAAYYPLAAKSVMLLTETLFTLLMAATIYRMLGAVDSKRPADYGIAGILAGISALCRPILLVLPLLLLAVLVVFFRKNFRLAAQGIALFSLGVLLTVGPWTARNYLAWGMLVPVSTEGGIVFWSGNYGRDGLWQRRDGFPPHIRRALSKGLSEGEENILLTKEALRIIQGDVPRFLSLAGKKFVRFWFYLGYPFPPSRMAVGVAVCHSVLFLFGLFSIRTMRNRPGLMLVLLLLGAFTLVHMITFGTARYSIPLIPFVAVLAAQGFFSLTRPLGRTGLSEAQLSKNCWQ